MYVYQEDTPHYNVDIFCVCLHYVNTHTYLSYFSNVSFSYLMKMLVNLKIDTMPMLKLLPTFQPTNEPTNQPTNQLNLSYILYITTYQQKKMCQVIKTLKNATPIHQITLGGPPRFASLRCYNFFHP